MESDERDDMRPHIGFRDGDQKNPALEVAAESRVVNDVVDCRDNPVGERS